MESSDSEHNFEEEKKIDLKNAIVIGETNTNATEIIICEEAIHNDFFIEDNPRYQQVKVESTIPPPKSYSKPTDTQSKKENEYYTYIAIDQEIAKPITISEFDEPLPAFDTDHALKKYTCDMSKLIMQSPYLNLFSSEKHREMLFKLSNLPIMDQFKACKKRADPYDAVHEGYFKKRDSVKVR